jgi:hypothetical protein
VLPKILIIGGGGLIILFLILYNLWFKKGNYENDWDFKK